MWNNSLQTLMVSTIMAVGVSLSACDSNKESVTIEDASAEKSEQTVAETVPSWFVGLGVQVALAALLLWWAWARTRTPSRALPPGTRIA